MSVTIGQLAALVQGQVHGSPDLVIAAARPLHEAGPDDVTFVENERNARGRVGEDLLLAVERGREMPDDVRAPRRDVNNPQQPVV